jgi:hypothetical protein
MKRYRSQATLICHREKPARPQLAEAASPHRGRMTASKNAVLAERGTTT